MNEQELYVYNYLKEQGLSPAGIAGVMGNLNHESGMNPGNLNNDWNDKYGLSDQEFTDKVNSGEIDIKEKSGAYGLAQWLGDRKKALADYAAEDGRAIDDLGMQCEFLMKELNARPGLLSYLKTTTNAQEASKRFQKEFEVCEAGTKDRINKTNDYYAQIETDSIPYVDTAVLGTMRAENGKEFDPQFYAQQYPDVAAAVGDNSKSLLQHYNEYGAAEGRLANPSELEYEQAPVEEAVETPEENASDIPTQEETPVPETVAETVPAETNEPLIADNGKTFDATFYMQQYPDVLENIGTDPKALLQHYNMFGASEGRLANPSDIPEVNQSGLEQVANNCGIDCDMDFELSDGSVLSIETSDGKSEFFLDGESMGTNARDVENFLVASGRLSNTPGNNLDGLIAENSAELSNEGINPSDYLNMINNNPEL